MKNIFKCLFAFSLLFAVGCDDVEPVMYNQVSGGTYLSFSSNVYRLPIVIDDEGQVDIVLNSSTVSSVDRVYNIEIIADQTNANPATYDLPSTITIPAGSNQAIVTVTGVDNGLVDSEVKKVVFRISNLTNESFDSNLVTLEVVEVCPFGDGVNFTGNYTVTQMSTGPIAGALLSGTVTLTDAGEFSRLFSSTIYPSAGPFGPFNFYINFSCGETSLGLKIDTGVACTPPPGQPRNNIQLEVADNQGTYNSNNDQVFFLRIKENTTGSCGAPTAETILRFTKQP